MIVTLYLAAATLALPVGTPAASTAAAIATTAAKPAAKRYCVDEATTGSRVPRRTCRTRAEWLAEGFDPLAPQS